MLSHALRIFPPNNEWLANNIMFHFCLHFCTRFMANAVELLICWVLRFVTAYRWHGIFPQPPPKDPFWSRKVNCGAHSVSLSECKDMLWHARSELITSYPCLGPSAASWGSVKGCQAQDVLHPAIWLSQEEQPLPPNSPTQFFTPRRGHHTKSR